MTLIIGIVEPDGSVYMGADSGVWGAGNLEMSSRAPKVFRVGDCLFGVAGQKRVSDVLRYCLEIPPVDGEADARWVVGALIPAIRKALEEHGVLQKGDGGQDDNGCSTILLGVEGDLYEIATDFSVGDDSRRYAAIGGAARVALGTLHYLSRRQETGAEAMARAAYDAAMEHTDAVRGEWRSEWLRRPGRTPGLVALAEAA